MKIRKESLSNIFGMVRNAGHRAHQGWDLMAVVGTPVYAISDGTIVDTGFSGDYGNYVILEFNYYEKKYFAFYAHLSQISKQKGDCVIAGEVIGNTGKTGNAAKLNSSEDHLHFEIRTSKNLGKGLTGRIDPGELLGYQYYACAEEPNEQSLME